MAPCKIDKINPTATEILCILFFFVACTFLTIGGVFYTRDRYKVLNYVHTTCQVQSASSKVIFYMQSFDRLIRYVPRWEMRYDTYYGAAQGTDEYKTPEEAQKQANKYRVYAFYPCWYDKKHPNVAQWDKPDTRIASVLISCGTILLAIGIGLLFLTHLLVRKIERTIQENRTAHVHVTFLK